MFKKILCPVDFSQFTQEVINYALDLAKKYGAELHLMHVVPNMTYFTPYESFLTPENLVAIEKNIQDEVERDFAKLLKGNGVPTKTVIRTGVPFVEIIDKDRCAVR